MYKLQVIHAGATSIRTKRQTQVGEVWSTAKSLQYVQKSEGTKIDPPLKRFTQRRGLANISKIRCSGERPICKRCVRLKHPCDYDSNPSASAQKRARNLGRDTSIVAGRCSSSVVPEAHDDGRAFNSNSGLRPGCHGSSTFSPQFDYPQQEHYLGIPATLVSLLVELYYENVYNASLLLHKRLFLESLTTDTARPHVVLSVCAWAAKYVDIIPVIH